MFCGPHWISSCLEDGTLLTESVVELLSGARNSSLPSVSPEASHLIIISVYLAGCRDSSVDIVTRLDDWCSFPGRNKRFFSCPKCAYRGWAHSVGTCGCSLEAKRPRREANTEVIPLPVYTLLQGCTKMALLYFCLCKCTKHGRPLSSIFFRPWSYSRCRCSSLSFTCDSTALTASGNLESQLIFCKQCLEFGFRFALQLWNSIVKVRVQLWLSRHEGTRGEWRYSSRACSLHSPCCNSLYYKPILIHIGIILLDSKDS